MHSLSYLPEVLLLLGICIFVVVTLHKLKISPVLGYLVIGALIGPNNPHNGGLIKDYVTANALAEFGIVFLVFVIGLDLTFERLVRMRFHVFGFGGLQILLTTLAITFCVMKFSDLETITAIVISAALALSSTAIVMQVLTENGRQSTQVGRLSLSVLLMQDFAVVPLLAVLPILASDSENLMGAVGLASVKALVTIVAITIVGRLFLRPFFSIIGSVKKDEVYVATALFIVLGSAWLTNDLGLSTAMGAFIAGLLIAETEYRNKIEASIMPFYGLFLALFFLTVGMSIRINDIIENLQKVIILSFGLLAVKAIIIFILCRIFRFSTGSSVHSSLLLSQGGEFAFILFNLAAKQNVISSEFSELLLMVVAFTMAITPLLSIIGIKIEDKLQSTEELDDSQEFKGVSDLNSHVIIAGFGRVGRVVSYMLNQEKIDYIALDSNASLVKKARKLGYPVYHGDLANSETLKSVGAQRATAIVLSMSDKLSVRKATKLIAKEFKNLKIIVRVEDSHHGKGIRKLGATLTIPTTIETGLQLGSAVLRDLDIPDHEVLTMKEKIRKNDYNLTEDIELFKGIISTENH